MSGPAAPHPGASLRPKLTINYIPALVTRGSVWKYKDDGSDQGTAWRTTSFDDSAWARSSGERKTIGR